MRRAKIKPSKQRPTWCKMTLPPAFNLVFQYPPPGRLIKFAKVQVSCTLARTSLECSIRYIHTDVYTFSPFCWTFERWRGIKNWWPALGKNCWCMQGRYIIHRHGGWAKEVFRPTAAALDQANCKKHFINKILTGDSVAVCIFNRAENKNFPKKSAGHDDRERGKNRRLGKCSRSFFGDGLRRPGCYR